MRKVVNRKPNSWYLTSTVPIAVQSYAKTVGISFFADGYMMSWFCFIWRLFLPVFSWDLKLDHQSILSKYWN
uniref:Uncharacterized protein n=1 Tax=Rhizophora mucronata TaxID=61149 RepID=A0A2P2IPS2_RHIMU